MSEIELERIQQGIYISCGLRNCSEEAVYIFKFGATREHICLDHAMRVRDVFDLALRAQYNR